MRFEIVTLFPELFDVLHVGLLGKAREEELLREAIVKDLVRIVLKRISTL